MQIYAGEGEGFGLLNEDYATIRDESFTEKDILDHNLYQFP